MEQNRLGVTLEDVIDIEKYILGPGDIIGVNIVATENMVFTLRVNPAGDLFMPTVGLVKVSGMTLVESSKSVQDIVRTTLFVNAKVNVTLIDIRKYRILVYGAVPKPGLVEITPVTRASEILAKVGGLQKYADEDNIILHKKDGSIINVSINDYLLTGDLDKNPTLIEGDKLEVKYSDKLSMESRSLLNLNNSKVLITGFVNKPGAKNYYPGYTVEDYIMLSGGVHINGTQKGIELNRNKENIFENMGQIVLPDDKLYINPSLRYRMFGNYNIMQMVTSFMSIYLSYKAATRKL